MLVPLSAVQGVGPRRGDQEVAARPAEQAIVAGPAAEAIVAFVAGQQVVPAASGEDVVARPPEEDVGAAVPPSRQEVVTLGSDESVGPDAAVEGGRRRPRRIRSSPARPSMWSA